MDMEDGRGGFPQEDLNMSTPIEIPLSRPDIADEDRALVLDATQRLRGSGDASPLAYAASRPAAASRRPRSARAAPSA